MSYQTLEVELENGRVHPASSETLPAKAHALLTILTSPAAESIATPARTMGDALRNLGATGRGEFSDLPTNKAHLEDFGR